MVSYLWSNSTGQEVVISIVTFSGRTLSMPKSFSDILFLQVQFLLHLWSFTALSRNHREKITCVPSHAQPLVALSPSPPQRMGSPQDCKLEPRHEDGRASQPLFCETEWRVLSLWKCSLSSRAAHWPHKCCTLTPSYRRG